jgi:hypothetical protein
MGSAWVVDTAGRGVGATGVGIADFVAVLRSNIINLIGQTPSAFTWYESLALCSVLGIVFLAVMIVGVIVVVMAYARAIEILLYIAIAPLPCSFVLMDNGQVTKRFLLQFLGVVLQGVLMLVIIIIFQKLVMAITGEINTTAPGDVWMTITGYASSMLIATITLMAAIVKSGSLAKQMLSG